MSHAMNAAACTSACNGSKRLDSWNDTVCKTYARVDSVCHDRDGFEAELSFRDFGAIQMTRVRSTPIEYMRRAEDIHADDCDAFMLSLKLEGRGHIRQDDREAVLAPGDIMLFDTARPYRLHFPENYSELLLKIPRTCLTARVTGMERVTAVRLPGDAPLGKLVASLIRQMSDVADALDGPTNCRVIDSALDLVAVAIDRIALENREYVAEKNLSLLHSVKAFMMSRLGDPDLSIESIARAHHVGPRTINRLFATEGTTTMRWLWQQRLAKSYQALSERRLRQVTQAALEFGFSDFSHFSRSFKNAFGVSPHSLLKTS